MKLKLLILSHSSELGGAEWSMIDLFDTWDRDGLIEPHFIIRHPLRNLVPELDKRKWRYHPIHYTNWSQQTPSNRAEDKFRNALYNSKAVAEIEKLIQDIKPDIVLTNTIVSPWAALAAHFQNFPHVWLVHEYGDLDHGHVFEIGRDKTFQDIGTLSDLVVANSKTISKYLTKMIVSNKIKTLYYPLSIEQIIKNSNKKQTNPFKDSDSLKLIVVGRIARSKGQIDIVSAVSKLKKNGHNVELAITGSASNDFEQQEVSDKVKKLNLSNSVHLLGQQTNPYAIMKYADVGIMASQREAFGRVTFEYMVTGKPVIGSSSGATPELVEHGNNGFLFKPGDAKDLTRQIKKYIKNKQLISIHGQNGILKAKKMMGGKYTAENLYKNLVKTVENSKNRPKQMLNFSRHWLDYPVIAEQYIKDAGVLSLKRWMLNKSRHRAKWAYLTAMRAVNFVRRGGKRASRL